MAARATFTTLQVAWMYMLAISLMYVLTPSVFLRGFYAGTATLEAEQTSVINMAARLMQFVAAYNLLDATLMVFVGALKGAGDTTFILRVSLVLAAMLAGFSWLGVERWDFGIYGCWMLITLWVWIAAATYVVRFRQGQWRRMRVIETSTDARLDAQSAAVVD